MPLRGRRSSPSISRSASALVLRLKSGVHATLAGVALALTIPLGAPRPDEPDASPAAAPRLEHKLHMPVAFVIVPIFGFANAGVSFAGMTCPSVRSTPVPLGIAARPVPRQADRRLRLRLASVRTGLADLPANATWPQIYGVALLCGIGFTMSLFIGLLAFDDPSMQDRVKYGILAGSLLSGVSGYLVLRFAGPR
jgi:NhaA family Na+:H+ antiporter